MRYELNKNRSNIFLNLGEGLAAHNVKLVV